MKKEIIIDLKDINTPKDLIHSFYGPLNLQIREGASYENWAAFNDDMGSFNFEFNSNEKPTHVNLILKNWESFEKNMPEESIHLLSLLAWNTDPMQRIDNIDFTFQIRLG